MAESHEEDYSSYYVDTALPEIPEEAAPCSYHVTSRFNQWFIPVTFLLVFVLGLIGNGLVLYVLKSRRCSWHLSDHYLFHLTLSDLLLGLTLPFWATQYAYGWVFSSIPCKLVGALFSINMYSSIFFLACIGLNRYFAIVHAVELHRKQRPIHTFLICAVVWATSCLLSLQEFYFRDVDFVEQSKAHSCHYKFNPETADTWRTTLRFINLSLGFLLPLFLMFFFYSRIFCTLRRSRHGHSYRSQVVIVVLLFVFVLCWGPYNTFLLIDSLQRLGVIGPNCSLFKKLDIGLTVTETLGLSHVCLNPFVYAFVGVKFKSELSRLSKRVSGKVVSSGFTGSKEESGVIQTNNSYTRVF
ncbi:C-X-C chemokine receptor type 3-2 [Xenopus laevis]|uniref:G-protein coupled receptors family 1 profile domain-containing protein n=2 Tax=Xenopus laevis TaxID=8355 RepID=A0A974HCP5_XENLA|nr:C-X-C chemokine receptor type 3-2 [Xenopus laevis]OCT73053.1 hypothetical protein XELAEV_18036032mg [Xenopus laevis]